MIEVWSGVSVSARSKEDSVNAKKNAQKLEMTIISGACVRFLQRSNLDAGLWGSQLHDYLH